MEQEEITFTHEFIFVFTPYITQRRLPILSRKMLSEVGGRGSEKYIKGEWSYSGEGEFVSRKVVKPVYHAPFLKKNSSSFLLQIGGKCIVFSGPWITMMLRSKELI